MAKVSVRGVIVPNDDAWIYDWCEMDNTSPAKVAREIEAANGEDLEVEINSGGGDIAAGSEIYTALRAYPGKVEVRIVGQACSAASVIAMAGGPTLMSPTALMMIHNVSSYQAGDHRAMSHMAEVLKTANVTIANAYTAKSGMAEKDVLAMMAKETWLTAQAAKEYGLIDGIMFDEAPALAAGTGMIPREVIIKMRNALQSEARFNLQKTQATQNLLKLKGARKNNDL